MQLKNKCCVLPFLFVSASRCFLSRIADAYKQAASSRGCADYGGPLIDPGRVLASVLASLHDPHTGALKVWTHVRRVVWFLHLCRRSGGGRLSDW